MFYCYFLILRWIQNIWGFCTCFESNWGFCTDLFGVNLSGDFVHILNPPGNFVHVLIKSEDFVYILNLYYVRVRMQITGNDQQDRLGRQATLTGGSVLGL